MTTSICDHDWKPYTDDELKALRSATRPGRPNGAWLENARQCARCGEGLASVSWYGQVHSVSFTPGSAAERPSIRWPGPGQGRGGSMGMG
jgi:hypothetical protein